MIKVRMTGPFSRRWIPLARYTWEQMHGPIPQGKRVTHLDGNTLNDNPANYGLLTPGQVINLYHQLDPVMSRENRLGEKRRSATAAHNRLRGQIRRATDLFPTRWYAANLAERIVYEEPFRSRRRLLARLGVHVEINGGISRRRRAALPFTIQRGHELLDKFGRAFRREPFSKCPAVGKHSEVA